LIWEASIAWQNTADRFCKFPFNRKIRSIFERSSAIGCVKNTRQTKRLVSRNIAMDEVANSIFIISYWRGDATNDANDTSDAIPNARGASGAIPDDAHRDANDAIPDARDANDATDSSDARGANDARDNAGANAAAVAPDVPVAGSARTAMTDVPVTKEEMTVKLRSTDCSCG
jgi:hypothetical protein